MLFTRVSTLHSSLGIYGTKLQHLSSFKLVHILDYPQIIRKRSKRGHSVSHMYLDGVFNDKYLPKERGFGFSSVTSRQCVVPKTD